MLDKKRLDQYDITQHPDINKYVLKSEVSGIINHTHNQYRRLNQYDIRQHPDINKYVLKSQIPEIIEKKNAELSRNCERHFINFRNTIGTS